MIGLIMFLLLLILTFFGEYLPLVDENLTKENHRIINGTLFTAPYEPSSEYWFGSDHEGRDLLSVIVLGAKETLLIVLLIAFIRYVIAIPLAYFAHKGFFGMKFLLNSLNAFFSYIPTIIVVIIFIILPPLLFSPWRPFWIIMIVAIVEVGRVSATLKSDFDQLSIQKYMLSGIAIGASQWRLLKFYYLPFVYEKLVVYFISDLGKVMFILGQLGFIGIFISQDLVQVDPGIFEIHNVSLAWPMLLANAYLDVRGPIWIVFWPTLAMTSTIFTFNMIAQGIQHSLQDRETYL